MITCSDLLNPQFRTANKLFQIAAVVGQARWMSADFCFPRIPLTERLCPERCVDELPLLPTYQEKGFHYETLPLLGNVDLKGFFQSWKYSHHVWDEIGPVFAGLRVFRRGCAIHVRRQDYVGRFADYMVELQEDYYTRATAFMRAAGINDFHIYTDDAEWCKKFPYEVHTGGDPLDVIREMSSYEAVITANSTFSVMAGLLTRNRYCVSPQAWFQGPWANKDTRDIVPWERL